VCARVPARVPPRASFFSRSSSVCLCACLWVGLCMGVGMCVRACARACVLCVAQAIVTPYSFAPLSDYPSGTHRRKHIYVMRNSFGRPLNNSQVEGLRQLGMQYWATHRPASLTPRSWEVDPVATTAGRARRARFMERRASASDLEARYRLFRLCSLDLSSRGH
jgi:hypothetical protein